MTDPKSLSCRQLEDLMQERGLPAFRGRQLFKWLWKNAIHSIDEITEFSKDLRLELARDLQPGHLKKIERLSSSDGTLKWAYELSDGLAIETVLIPERGHTTLCVSTQAGCAMGCSFCLTGKMGFFRNLDPSEIAGQILEVTRDVPGEMRPRNLVFMGMGEPLANFQNLMTAIEILTCDLGLNFSQRRITVSTSGIAPRIVELGEKTGVGLAISLHATTNEQRDGIMPVNRSYPIEALLEACRKFRMPARRRITFEYLLLRDVNDSTDDALRLSRLLRGIPSKINLIPFNQAQGLPFREPDRDKVLRFQEILKEKNYTVIIRKSKGRDIKAACGQLFYQQQDKTARGKAEATNC